MTRRPTRRDLAGRVADLTEREEASDSPGDGGGEQMAAMLADARSRLPAEDRHRLDALTDRVADGDGDAFAEWAGLVFGGAAEGGVGP